jgi:hypothetical protein
MLRGTAGASGKMAQSDPSYSSHSRTIRAGSKAPVSPPLLRSLRSVVPSRIRTVLVAANLDDGGECL